MALWYAALLARALALFCASTYIGLQRYLQKSLEETLVKQARSIGDVLLVNINQSGEDYVTNEITEHYSPEINGRFIRITRADGKWIFVSGPPKDASFDPVRVPAPALPVAQGFSREIEMSDGHELLLHGLPFTVDDIRQKAAKITSRNLSERLPVVHTGDELERLATDLNHMIERLEESFQQINRFSADASHELRTPLTVLQGELEAMAEKDHNLPAEVRDTIRSGLEETQRLAKIVESLLAISR